MQIWSCTPGAGDAAQHFTVTADNRIQWTSMNKCLDLTGGSLASGNQVYRFHPPSTVRVCLIASPFCPADPDVGLLGWQH
jgi:hypothetical protein